MGGGEGASPKKGTKQTPQNQSSQSKGLPSGAGALYEGLKEKPGPPRWEGLGTGRVGGGPFLSLFLQRGQGQGLWLWQEPGPCEEAVVKSTG